MEGERSVPFPRVETLLSLLLPEVKMGKKIINCIHAQDITSLYFNSDMGYKFYRELGFPVHDVRRM